MLFDATRRRGRNYGANISEKIFGTKWWEGEGGGKGVECFEGYQSKPETLRMSSDIDLQQIQIREETRGEGGSSNRRGEIAAEGGRECEGLIDNIPVPGL